MQWFVPRILIQITDEKERETAKVIAMEMAEKNDIQPSRIKASPFHRQQRRWPTVHEEKPVGGLDKIATLVAAAVTERISTAEDIEFHDLSSVSFSVVCRSNLYFVCF